VTDKAEIRTFIENTTDIVTPPLAPELRLRLAREAHGIFQDAHTLVSGGLGARPYWAFAWPGGQALARHILDNPDIVRGKRVLDLGAGSAIAGIAAMMAGARAVTAADIDPLAVEAIAMNAALNGVDVTPTADDLLGTDTRFDLVIVGDLVYEPDLKDRVGLFIASHKKRGVPMLYGDRTTARRPPGDFQLLAEHEAPLTPPLAENFIERARVWML
jgi:predicted nicotinamide N-methyase